jgi:hypothetical protein
MSTPNVTANEEVKSVISSYQVLQVLDVEFQKEQNKGKNAQFEKMLMIAFSIMMVVNHIDSRERAIINRALDRDMKEVVKRIQANSISYIGITFTAISAVVSIAGAAAGAGYLNAFLGAQANAQYISGAGTAIGQLSQIPTSINQSRQAGDQAEQAILTQKQQSNGEARSRCQQIQQQSLDHGYRIHEASHRAFAGS